MFLFYSCSFTHVVQVENASAAPITITYKLRPAPYMQGMFTAQPRIMRKQGRHHVPDSSTVMDPADSTVRFTLLPGDRTTLARCFNCTFTGFTRPNASDAFNPNGPSRMNLYWMKLEQGSAARTYTPAQLVTLASKTSMQRTVFQLKNV